jgi:hypothetical protein
MGRPRGLPFFVEKQLSAVSFRLSAKRKAGGFRSAVILSS